MVYNLQGKLTDEEIESILKINPKLPLETRKISIDLDKNSYSSRYSACLPACCVIAYCYWQDHIPQLDLPKSRDYWENYINKCSSRAIKGVNLPMIRMNLPKEYRKFIYDEKNLRGFSDLIPPFYAWKFPLIQIVLFDRNFSFKEQSGSGHAAIISKVNMQEKSLLLIDPVNTNKQDIIIESHMHMRDFAKGWKLFQNSVILIYPKEIVKYLKIKTGKTSIIKKFKQEYINKYM